MENSDRPRSAASRDDWVVVVAGIYALFGGASSLLGWVIDVRRLTDWYNNGISIQPNAAVCVALSGLALLLLSARRRNLAAVCGSVVALIGGATLLEWLTGFSFGIDSLLLFGREWGRVGVVVPGRMGPPGSLSWTLIGTSLVLAASTAAARRFAPPLALLTLALSLLSITGYLYGASILYTMPRLTVIALQTATFITAVSLGLIAGVPERQPMRLLLEDSTAGLLARRVLPVLIIVPLILGGLRVWGQNAGLFDTAFGTTIRTVVEVVLLIGLLWWSLLIVNGHESAQRATAAALRASEDRKVAILNSAIDCLIAMDHEGRIIDFNPAAERAFGRARDEVIGKTVAETIIPPRLRGAHWKGLHRLLRTGESRVLDQLIELPALRADGSEFPAELWITSSNPASGVPFFTAFLRDISQRKRGEQSLRESEERFRAIADNIPQLAWMAEPGTSGQASWFNKAWLDYTGTTLEQNQGSGWQSVHHPDHAERVIAKFELHVRENRDWEDTFPLRGKDGSYRWFLSRMNVIRDETGKVARMFGTNTDITAQRELEQALQQADRRKDEFLATLAHELRNPLAPLRHMLEILKQTGGDGQVLQQARDTMERQLGQMVRLVDDLLDLSRITRDKLELRPEQVELASVLYQAVEACKPLAERANHALHVALPREPIYLHGDPVRLAQVFSNLLNNSCKYTPPGGQVWLRAERQGSDVSVSVKDTGAGIPSDKLESIFDMFTQVDSSLERSQGGLGIGLTLVKRLVNLHGGSITARSEGEGRGSEFEVRLPVVLQRKAPAAPVPLPVPGMKAVRRRILIVDDNRDAAISLSMLLKISGNETHTAHDGQQALDAAAKLAPEVMLLDIGLPVLNGYDVCRSLRARPGGSSMVIIALTGWGQEEDRRKSQEAGFDGHLVKPVDFAQLTNLLTTLAPAAIAAV